MILDLSMNALPGIICSLYLTQQLSTKKAIALIALCLLTPAGKFYIP